VIVRLLSRFPWLSRVARPASVAWNVTKTAIQATVFWSLLLVAVPLVLRAVGVWLGLESPGWPPAAAIVGGAVIFVAASTLNLAAARAIAVHGDGTPLPIDATRRLVVRGPYRYVRNPMAIAGIGQGVAVGVMLGSWIVVAYAVAGALFWQVLVRPWEEADLRERFGPEFDAYRAAVPCWVPRRGGWDAVGPDGLEPPTSSV
jgi:protein-S-isoprenylcysteine O-methyltransferase Ste14